MPVASNFTAEPMAVPSAIKVTGPVGMPPLPVTFAVKVTVANTVEGFGAAVTMAEVIAWTTVKPSGADALVLSFESPEYVATMECNPGAKVGLIEADPDDRPVLPSVTVAPPNVSLNVTVPAGLGAPANVVTVAVRTTGAPAIPVVGTADSVVAGVALFTVKGTVSVAVL